MTNKKTYEKEAADFCKLIRYLAESPERLESLECYLSCHFQDWLEKFIDTPESIAAELAAFAEMEV